MYSNPYWGKGYVELQELECEFLELYKEASTRRDFALMLKYEEELRLVRDAIYAYERG